MATTSQITVRFLPGLSGTVTSGSATSRTFVSWPSMPVRSYSRAASQSSSWTTTSMRFCCRTARIPNRAWMSIHPAPRIRAVRQQKRIEVVVQLEDWDAAREYDRTGIDGQTTQVLEVTLPIVTVPLNPGKNLTVVCEVVAMNHLLRYSGVDSARAFNDRLLKRLAERRQLQEYLEEDNE